MENTPKLIVLSEQFCGRTFELSKDEMSIGRVDERDICVKDPTVSTNHCTIIRRDNRFFVRDNGSTNGTRINGAPINPNEENELFNTDVLHVGGIEMLFESDDKSVTTVMRTTTDIDINAGQATQTLERIDTSAFRPRKKNSGTNNVFIVIIILLVLALLCMAGILVMSLNK